MLKEVSFHWGPEIRAARSAAPNNPLWLLGFVSELCSQGLRHLGADTSHISKLNVILYDYPVERDGFFDQHQGIASVVLSVAPSAMEFRDCNDAVDLGVALVWRALGVLVSHIGCPDLRSGDLRQFVHERREGYVVDLKKGRVNSNRLKVAAFVTCNRIDVRISFKELSGNAFSTWPGLEFLKLRLLDREVRDDAVVIYLSDEWRRKDEERFGVRLVSLAEPSIWSLEKYEYHGRDRVALVCLLADMNERRSM